MLFPSGKAAVNAVLDLDTSGGRHFISREDYQLLEGSRDSQQYIYCIFTFHDSAKYLRLLSNSVYPSLAAQYRVPHPGPT